MMFSTTGLTPRGSQGAARPAEDPAHGDFLESSESGMFLYAERAEQQQQQQQQQSHSPTEPSSPFGAPAQQARTPPSSQVCTCLHRLHGAVLSPCRLHAPDLHCTCRSHELLILCLSVWPPCIMTCRHVHFCWLVGVW